MSGVANQTRGVRSCSACLVMVVFPRIDPSLLDGEPTCKTMTSHGHWQPHVIHHDRFASRLADRIAMDTAPKLLVPSLVMRPCVRPCPLLTHQIRFWTSEPWQHMVGVCEGQLTELFSECEATGVQCMSGADPTCESSAVRCYAWANAMVKLLSFREERPPTAPHVRWAGTMLACVKFCSEARRSAFGMFVLVEKSAFDHKRCAARNRVNIQRQKMQCG